MRKEHIHTDSFYEKWAAWAQIHPYAIREWLYLHIVEFGCSQREIAAAFNITSEALGRYCRRFNVFQLRKGFEKEKINDLYESHLSLKEVYYQLELYHIPKDRLISYFSHMRDPRWVATRKCSGVVRGTKVFTEAQKKQVSERMTRLWTNPEWAKKQTSRIWTKKKRDQQSKVMKRRHAEGLSKKVSKAMSIGMKRRWSNSEWVKNWRKKRGCVVRPNYVEGFVDEHTSNNVKYTGDFGYLVVFKNSHRKFPDFVVGNGQEKIIEVLGERFHPKIHKWEYLYRYGQMDRMCLVIWAKNILQNPEEVVKKLARFEAESYKFRLPLVTIGAGIVYFLMELLRFCQKRVKFLKS